MRLGLSKTLTLTKQEAADFARSNQKAMGFFMAATGDYAAARCCLINGLFSGLVLSAQAVEKLLKGYLLVKKPEIDARKISHNLPELLTQVMEADSSLDLSKFQPLIVRLKQHYQTRYPDNSDASTSMSTGEMIEIDELIFYINQNLPVPDEIKFRSGIYGAILWSKVNGYVSGEERWIKENNQAIQSELKNLELRFDQVMKHVYPSAT
jgi:HEPN domain-containing protein